MVDSYGGWGGILDGTSEGINLNKEDMSKITVHKKCSKWKWKWKCAHRW